LELQCINKLNMEDLQQQIEKIKSEFYLSNSLLAILFIISFTGLTVGFLGWLHVPVYLWTIPDSYYPVLFIAALILMGLTLTGGILNRNLRISFTEIDFYGIR
jgi:hypothetical protein